VKATATWKKERNDGFTAVIKREYGCYWMARAREVVGPAKK